ncbi:hypothetical protein AVEN_90421-1 [Araneus ventricosus]|uniref:Uncharacterized protein n=1 Tax=Araneus ventricosus TaxID=182803 RepID=A0A4Y2U3V6_ARAVE|nr:hypothetical protein AVEN_90421-1 [Araneus ventricosus]
MPLPRGCLPKSELIRDFQSADHTALFGAPEPETQFETPNPFLPPSPSLLEHSVLFPFKEWSSAYLSLHWIMVLLVYQQFTFLVINPYYGKVLEFHHHRAIQA